MSDKGGGVFAALKDIAATLLVSGKTRLELLGNEIEEEKLRAIRIVFMAQCMVICFGFATLLSVALLTILYWDSRLFVLSATIGFLLLLGGVFFVLFRQATVRSEQIFAASIAELQKDICQLKAAVGYEPPNR